jgi:hypothetical protein
MNQSIDYTTLLQALVQRHQILNEFVAQLDNSVHLFGKTNIPSPHDSLWECHFQRLVSWLYVLYWEVGKKADLQFLIELFQVYELGLNSLVGEHPFLVRSLRTIAQHNVVAQNSEVDLRPQRHCQRWFTSTCGSLKPIEDDHWQQCLRQILHESEIFLDTLQQCLICLSKDESCEEILKQWRLRRERKFSPWDYDDLIREVMSDLGLEGQKQVVLIRNRYQSQWDEHLKNLSVQSNFKKQIKRRILDTLLTKTEILMPLDADDIIENFQIEAGDPRIRKLLVYARGLFHDSPELKQDGILELLEIYFEQL